MSRPESCRSICSATTDAIRVGSLVGTPRAGRAGRPAPPLTGPNRPGKEEQMDTMTAIRSTVHRPRHIPLTAGPAAAGEARGQVRSAIAAWDVPVDPATAALLTSELVT